MLKISFQLKKSTTNRRDESPIAMMLYEDKNSKYAIRTGLFCPLSCWDKKRNVCKGEYERVNIHLTKLKNDVADIEDRFVLAKESYTPQLIWENYKNPTTKLKYEKPILEIINEINEARYKAKEFCEPNYKTHKHIISKITYFLTKKGLEKIGYDKFSSALFDELITFARFTRFDKNEVFISEKQVKNSFLKRLAQKVMEGNAYALKYNYAITPLLKLANWKDDADSTQALTWEEFEELNNLDLTKNHALDAIRDVFLFSCYVGFQFCDMRAFDAKEHIYTDNTGRVWIRKAREKTGVQQHIPMMPRTKALLEKWNYILPMGVEQTHNKEIKNLAKIVGVKKRISNRCGRKTAGVVWQHFGATMQEVSTMLGHADIRITQKNYASIDIESLTRGTDCLRSEEATQIQQIVPQTTPQIVPQAQNIDLSNVLANLTAEIAKMNANNQPKNNQ